MGKRVWPALDWDACATSALAFGAAESAIADINRAFAILSGIGFVPIRLSGTTIELGPDSAAAHYPRIVISSSFTITARAFDPTITVGLNANEPPCTPAERLIKAGNAKSGLPGRFRIVLAQGA